ncbi:Serine/threonine-protein phosphatase 2A 56 kDa regulatory subunit beta isoform [Desmophyllum pertusum]|uniref:Serine/threonine-protein phosphatase 2A 56 kDa regulatory subunit beta isoform n=1 Tax=Desmophyllum pertusum TaxID=174260 RepID=A0A9X0CJ94_9CNID|nr:Serine/threonine-protein phosphatase 2A 56 kDa regulatory subunit beta isoform [Desmophyllum pertusum]
MDSVEAAKRPGINPAPATSNPDPFNRKSVRKPQKSSSKKQQGSSRFRSKPSFEIQPLTPLKGG